MQQMSIKPSYSVRIAIAKKQASWKQKVYQTKVRRFLKWPNKPLKLWGFATNLDILKSNTFDILLLKIEKKNLKKKKNLYLKAK